MKELSSLNVRIREKTNVSSAEIISENHNGSTYYSIKYKTLNGEEHIGFSSYNLDFVKEWMKLELNIVKKKIQTSYDFEKAAKNAVSTYLLHSLGEQVKISQIDIV